MNDNIQKDQLKTKKTLKKEIIFEYSCLFILICLYFLLPFIANYLIGDNTGLDNIGSSLAIAIILKGILFILTLIFCIINPIRILIVYKKKIKEIISKTKKIICRVVIILPILFSLLIILEVPISNFIFYLKYESDINAYTVNPKNYKLPIDFYNELKKRNLLYNKNTYNLMNRLNDNHNCINFVHYKRNITTQNCYSKATMMGIEKETYYDELNHSNINNMNKDSFPVYIYNAILTLPSKEEKLQYAALGRFSYNSDDYGNYNSFYNDYYIECKILYVDGNIYAIIGIGQSYDVERSYDYQMIIAEKNNITTFTDGKYHPNGAISIDDHKYEMFPNTNKNEWSEFYKIKKVYKLDADSINSIAEELQDKVLKNSIEYHFKYRNNK